MENIAFKFPEFERGTVWVVGAGPGDPGLLSLLALHGIQNADVIVYDALVGEGILSYVLRGKTPRSSLRVNAAVDPLLISKIFLTVWSYLPAKTKKF